MRRIPIYPAAGCDGARGFNVHRWIGAACGLLVTRREAVRLMAWSYAATFKGNEPLSDHDILTGWLWGRFGAVASDISREARALAGLDW